jgi:hypothetical protein
MPLTSHLPALSGFGAGISILAGIGLLSELLGAFGDPDSTFVAHFADSDNRAPTILGSTLLFLGALLLLPFMTGLSDRLAEPATTALTTVRSLTGVAVALVCVAAAMLMTVDLSRLFADLFDEEMQPLDGVHAAIPPQLGYVVLLLAAAYLFAAVVAILSLTRLRMNGPRDLAGWLGVLTAVLLLLSPAVTPFLLLPIWVIAWSVTLWRAPDRS